jgi:predicted PurR-regulated permease PerM|tara:strand:- start:385 stop:1701 length:1317 start_codon:yes stop_codon:yes gene_type:complete
VLKQQTPTDNDTAHNHIAQPKIPLIMRTLPQISHFKDSFRSTVCLVVNTKKLLQVKSLENQAKDSEKLPKWVIKSIATLLGGFALLWYFRGIISALRPLLIILLVSLFLSFALEPAVNRLEKLGLKRGIGTALTFLVCVAALGGFGFQVGSLLADQVTEFNNNIPTYLADIDEFLDDNFGIENATSDLQEKYDSGALAQWLGDFADDLARFGSTVANVLFQLFTIALFSFYLVAEGPKVRKLVCSFLAPRRQGQILEVWDLAVSKTGGYILSRSVLAVLSGAIHWLIFEIIGLPSALALALWVGVISQFVPVVGTYIAGVLPLVVGLLGEPVDGLWVLITIAVYQQIENYLISPRITSHTMQIHPAVAFGSVIAGSAILGVVGALLALPAAATIQSVIGSVARRHEVSEELLTTKTQREGSLNRNKLEDIPPEQKTDD